MVPLFPGNMRKLGGSSLPLHLAGLTERELVAHVMLPQRRTPSRRRLPAAVPPPSPPRPARSPASRRRVPRTPSAQSAAPCRAALGVDDEQSARGLAVSFAIWKAFGEVEQAVNAARRTRPRQRVATRCSTASASGASSYMCAACSNSTAAYPPRSLRRSEGRYGAPPSSGAHAGQLDPPRRLAQAARQHPRKTPSARQQRFMGARPARDDVDRFDQVLVRAVIGDELAERRHRFASNAASSWAATRDSLGRHPSLGCAGRFRDFLGSSLGSPWPPARRTPRGLRILDVDQRGREALLATTREAILEGCASARAHAPSPRALSHPPPRPARLSRSHGRGVRRGGRGRATAPPGRPRPARAFIARDSHAGPPGRANAPTRSRATRPRAARMRSRARGRGKRATSTAAAAAAAAVAAAGPPRRPSSARRLSSPARPLPPSRPSLTRAATPPARAAGGLVRPPLALPPPPPSPDEPGRDDARADADAAARRRPRSRRPRRRGRRCCGLDDGVSPGRVDDAQPAAARARAATARPAAARAAARAARRRRGRRGRRERRRGGGAAARHRRLRRGRLGPVVAAAAAAAAARALRRVPHGVFVAPRTRLDAALASIAAAAAARRRAAARRLLRRQVPHPFRRHAHASAADSPVRMLLDRHMRLLLLREIMTAEVGPTRSRASCS